MLNHFKSVFCGYSDAAQHESESVLFAYRMGYAAMLVIGLTMVMLCQ